jgi:hypothetical protein
VKSHNQSNHQEEVVKIKNRQRLLLWEKMSIIRKDHSKGRILLSQIREKINLYNIKREVDLQVIREGSLSILLTATVQLSIIS